MLRRLVLRDFVIVSTLDVAFGGGFSVLTGETGAGKSILIDALQLALGSRGDAGVVREGAARADISAEFDTPASLNAWLDTAGFEPGDATADATLLLRRTIDAQGKSRAWINGGTATVSQLREVADHLVDIHGQHAWQSLTRTASIRALLDAYGRVDGGPMLAAWQRWKAAADALTAAQAQHADAGRERERLAWQIGEVDKLAPGADEWAELNAEHQKLSNTQALIDGARSALQAVDGSDDGDAMAGAASLCGSAVDALQSVAAYDSALAAVVDELRGAQAQLQDAAHTLSAYLHRIEPEPDRLAALDERLAGWLSLARRYRQPPAELPALLAQWRDELQALNAAADADALQLAADAAAAAFGEAARRVSKARQKAAPVLAAAVTQAMQQLGMAGGRFEVALTAQPTPQSFGLESAEFLVAGHAGSTPRALAKVASGGELSRIALAISVSTMAMPATLTAPAKADAIAADTGERPAGSADMAAGTLIFDEVDAGVGGAVAETVGRLMKQLGRDRQVLAVTHLPQVAACADAHFVVSKTAAGGQARSDVQAVSGEARVGEIARMLGGERLSGTSIAHAQEMLAGLSARVETPPGDGAGA